MRTEAEPGVVQPQSRTPGAPGDRKTRGKLSPEPLEGAWLCRHLDLGILAFRARSAVVSHPAALGN